MRNTGKATMAVAIGLTAALALTGCTKKNDTTTGGRFQRRQCRNVGSRWAIFIGRYRFCH